MLSADAFSENPQNNMIDFRFLMNNLNNCILCRNPVMFRNNSVFQVGSRFRCNTTIIPGNPRGKKKPGEQLLQCSMETARLERKQKNKNWHQHHFSRVCSSRPRVWELGLDWRRVRSLRGGRLGRGRWSSKESRWPCS